MGNTAKDTTTTHRESHASSLSSAVSPERVAEINRWLEAKRSLVFSGDVDGAYIDLHRNHTTSNENSHGILKLRLKDSTDEAYHRQELQKILKEGGVLVLDLRGADPKLIKEWNSLYDFDAAGKGVQEISSDLRIVALADRDAHTPPESVTSRSAKFYDQRKDTKPDPLLALQGDHNTKDTHKINLHQDADPKTWRYELIGDQKKPGALIAAMQNGTSLEIQNAPLDQNSKGGVYDPELANLLRQVAIEKRIIHKGEWVYAQSGFELKLSSIKENIPEALKIETEDESTHSDTRAGRLSTFYVNRHTIGMLFSRTVIHDGKLRRKTGLLDIRPENSVAPIKLVITEDLPVGKWNKLLSHPALRDSQITVAVRESVSVPKPYRSLQSDKLQARVKSRDKAGEAPKPTQLKDLKDAVSSQNITLLRAELDLAHAEIKKQLNDKSPVYLQVTPYRSDEELWEGIAVDRENKKFLVEKTAALKALQDPSGVVVLSGIDSRIELFHEQPGLNAPEPYLLVHGRVVPIIGKLILVERSKNNSQVLSDEKREHLGVPKNLFKKLKEFEEALKTIPAHLGAIDKELYPSEPRTNLNKLALLVAQAKSSKDWAAAVDLVFGGDYGLHPEARAFIRVQARRIFESGTRKSPALSSQVIRAVQDSSGKLAESSSHMWRLLDAFNGAALKQVTVSDSFTARLSAHSKAWQVIKRSLSEHSTPELKKMYRERFNLSEKEPGEISIKIANTSDSKSPWTRMRDTSIELLTGSGAKPQVLFLQGAPGRGKSHLIRDIRDKLQDSRKMFGPLTANPDMVFKSTELDKLLADWRSSQGGILLIDEGNLLPKHFWDRLREDLLADPKKAIVFSGNETFQSGRQPIALAEELGVTLFFEQFSKDEKALMIDKYTQGLTNQKEAVQLILELTGFLENNQFGQSFTPRDLQEVSDWARFFGSSKEELIMHIWRVYSPVFTREQQDALSVYTKLRYGVDPHCSIKEQDESKSSMSTIREEFKDRYFEPMKANGFVLQDESLAVATELAKIVELSRKRGESNISEGGKRGVIIEAESGWGKDFTAVKTLEALGFTRGELADTDIKDIPKEGAKRYYVINAELDFTTLQTTIHRAAKEGAVLIIREANALDAGILEAQVNDILTGNVSDGVHPAFLTVMTVNSADVESMSAFSSALISRVHHIKARPHSRETLEEMVSIAVPNLSSDIISQIAGLHLYLRDIAGVDGRRPNTRDLLRAANEALKWDGHWRYAVIESYLFYIEHGIKGTDAIKDAHHFLSDKAKSYVAKTEINPARIMKALTQVALPKYVGEIGFVIDPNCSKINADGYFQAREGKEGKHIIAISPEAIIGRWWPRTILHEALHALNDCGMGCIFGDLEQDIRDLRNQASFSTLVPEARMMELTGEEAGILRLLQDPITVFTRPGSNPDFGALMAVIAKTEDPQLSKAKLEDLRDKLTENNGYIAVLDTAIKHFDLIREISRCFATREFGGETPSLAEIHAKQVRLTEIVDAIYQDYQNLPEEVEQQGSQLSAGQGIYIGDREPGFGGAIQGIGEPGMYLSGEGASYGQYGYTKPREESYDPIQIQQALEDACGIPRGGLSGPEGVTHDSSKNNGSDSESGDLIKLTDSSPSRESFKTPELSEEAKRILSEAYNRAAKSDSTPWLAPKELWEDVVSDWSESSVSNGRKSDPAGTLEMGELFNGVRVEDARVSPGAEVSRERKVIRIAELNASLSADELGLFQELFSLGFAVAIGDKECVTNLVALCIQEQERDGAITKEELYKRLTPADIKSSTVVTLPELKVHLEAVAAYAAIIKGVELLEQKIASGDVLLAKRIAWPALQDASRTNELVLEYLEDNESLILKLRALTKDVTKTDGQRDIELYMKQLEAELGQEEEPDDERVPKSKEEMAQMALDSYQYDPTTGVSTFVRPKGVSDVKLMRALNKYFRDHYPNFGRDAITNVTIDGLDKLPTRFPELVHARVYSESSSKSSRTITITALAAGTLEKNWDDQEKSLQNASLSFSDFRDIVLAAALHACKKKGEDLFRGKSVRGSVPGFAACTLRDFGVHVFKFIGDCAPDVAASGSSSPKPK